MINNEFNSHEKYAKKITKKKKIKKKKLIELYDEKYIKKNSLAIKLID